MIRRQSTPSSPHIRAAGAAGSSSDDELALDGHSHAQAVLGREMVAVASEAPEYYNDDTAWGDAIARAVAASSQVGAWPGALQRLCEAASLQPEGLMERRELVVGFKTFGLAEAEVLELLLRVSSELQALTLHDGGMGGAWADEAKWARCVSAIARGVGATRQLLTLNLRHFSLRGEAGATMAAALASGT